MKNKNYNKSKIHKTIEKKLKIMDDFQKKYPHLTRLNIPIYDDKSCDYVRGKDLDNALTKKERRLFSKYFGCQTCLALDDGTAGLYPYDCEAVLERMFSGKLTGTQLFWD